MKRLNFLWLSTEQLWIKNTIATKNARNSCQDNDATGCVPAIFCFGQILFKFLKFSSDSFKKSNFQFLLVKY